MCRPTNIKENVLFVRNDITPFMTSRRAFCAVKTRHYLNTVIIIGFMTFKILAFFIII